MLSEYITMEASAVISYICKDYEKVLIDYSEKDTDLNNKFFY